AGRPLTARPAESLREDPPVATAPPEDQRRLLEVQALDTRLQQLVHQRRNHPALATIAELDGRIADLHGSLVDSRTAGADLARATSRSSTPVRCPRRPPRPW